MSLEGCHFAGALKLDATVDEERRGLDVADDLARRVHLERRLRADVPAHHTPTNDNGRDVDFRLDIGPVADDECVIARDSALKVPINANSAFEGEFAFKGGSAPKERRNFRLSLAHGGKTLTRVSSTGAFSDATRRQLPNGDGHESPFSIAFCGVFERNVLCKGTLSMSAHTHDPNEIAPQTPPNDGVDVVGQFVSSAALRVDAVRSSEFMSRGLRAISRHAHSAGFDGRS